MLKVPSIFQGLLYESEAKEVMCFVHHLQHRDYICLPEILSSSLDDGSGYIDPYIPVNHLLETRNLKSLWLETVFITMESSFKI